MAEQFPAIAYLEDNHFEIEVLVDAWEDADGLRLDLRGHSPYKGAADNWTAKRFLNDAFKAVVQAAVNADEDIKQEAYERLEQQRRAA